MRRYLTIRLHTSEIVDLPTASNAQRAGPFARAEPVGTPIKTTPFDPRHNRGKHSLHSYFLIKSLALTRPHGVMLALTSRYTMDARNPAARRELAQYAEGSGFHLMRGICTVVIWGGRPGGGRGLIGVGEVGATRACREGSASC